MQSTEQRQTYQLGVKTKNNLHIIFEMFIIAIVTKVRFASNVVGEDTMPLYEITSKISIRNRLKC